MNNKVKDIVIKSINDFNEQLESDEILGVDENTILFGEGSTLDSLGLVNLIVSIEENIEEDLGITISLANEETISGESSPFSTVGTLITYLSKQLN